MPDVTQRIEAMHKRDVLVAWAFVLALWLVIVLAAYATWTIAPNGTVRLLLPSRRRHHPAL